MGQYVTITVVISIGFLISVVYVELIFFWDDCFICGVKVFTFSGFFLGLCVLRTVFRVIILELCFLLFFGILFFGIFFFIMYLGLCFFMIFFLRIMLFEKIFSGVFLSKINFSFTYLYFDFIFFSGFYLFFFSFFGIYLKECTISFFVFFFSKLF